ncbi:hypothetical protein JXA12_05010 [Candidatus Woesearchaeota archaeon]|nr:hypothetical protein [Candidatus Woesearchaeota archaeon]
MGPEAKTPLFLKKALGGDPLQEDIRIDGPIIITLSLFAVVILSIREATTRLKKRKGFEQAHRQGKAALLISTGAFYVALLILPLIMGFHDAPHEPTPYEVYLGYDHEEPALGERYMRYFMELFLPMLSAAAMLIPLFHEDITAWLQKKRG